MCIFSLIILIITLSTRPRLYAWPGLLVDLFAILFSAAVLFMTVNIFDQRRDRNDPILENNGEIAVRFRESYKEGDDPKLERWLSIGVGFAIVGVYGVLLYGKWIGMWW